MQFEQSFLEILTHLGKFHDAVDLKVVDRVASMISSSNQIKTCDRASSKLLIDCSSLVKKISEESHKPDGQLKHFRTAAKSVSRRRALLLSGLYASCHLILYCR